MADMNKVSIVTVSYNAENTIRKTIESVLYQTYPYIEYIVIDGVSTDATYHIVCEYDEKFEKRGISYVHISEPDKGIYDAMNKGLNYCTGEWINYMNANDRFYQNTTLEEVFSKSYDDDTGCIYGNTWLARGDRKYFKRADQIEAIYYRNPFSHQAAFVAGHIFQRYKFDTDYELAADYDFFLKMYLNGEKFERIDCDIALYDILGTSHMELKKTIGECKVIQKKNRLRNHYRVSRFVRNNIIIPLRRNRVVFDIYFFYMEMRKRT